MGRQLTVNELMQQLRDAVDVEDRDHVTVRLVVHGQDAPTQTAAATHTNGGGMYNYVNIIGLGK